MSVRKLVSFFAFIVMGAALVAVPAPSAQAAPAKRWAYAASTGGTYIKVFDGTISSDYTANAAIAGVGNQTASNSTAAVNVTGLASVGAVQTKTTAVENAAGDTTVTSYARTAGVNLLNGIVSVDAVETTASTTGTAADTNSFSSSTKLAGIKVLGVTLPVTIPQNFAVTIPGVATLTANYTLNGRVGNAAANLSWGLGIQLLTAQAGFPAGVTVLINPVYHYFDGFTPSPGANLYGGAYGSRIEAKVGTVANVNSDPTAYVPTPLGGSSGKTITQSTLGVNVPAVLNAGAVQTTTTSSRDDLGNATISNTAQIAGVNLLGGLVKADAIKVTATGTRKDGVWTHDEQMTLVNLVIAGQSIPVNVGPNFTLDVAGLGKVEINKRVVDAASLSNGIYGVRITISAANLGLPVGAVVELAVAGTLIQPTS